MGYPFSAKMRADDYPLWQWARSLLPLRLRRGTMADPPFIGYLESPQPLELRRDGALWVSGWLLSRGGAITSMSLTAMGREVPVRFGLLRPDIARKFADERGAAASGFRAELPIDAVASGELNVEIWAEMRGGRRLRCFACRVRVRTTRPVAAPLPQPSVPAVVPAPVDRAPPVESAPAPPVESAPAPPVDSAPALPEVAPPIDVAPPALDVAPPVIDVATPIHDVAPLIEDPAPPMDVEPPTDDLALLMNDVVLEQVAAPPTDTPEPLAAASGSTLAALSFVVHVLRPRVMVELAAGNEAPFSHSESIQWYTVGPRPHARRISASPAEALRHFTSGTVDLIVLRASARAEWPAWVHAWLPKMSRRGVVLVEDIEAGAILWKDLAARHRHTRLPHGRGTGLLLVGGEPVVRALEHATPEDVSLVADFLAAPPIHFEAPEAPAVSIVIPVHNQWSLTRACLLSIAAHTPPGEFEVMVVDDASDDWTPCLLPHIRGLRLLRNGANRGFVDTCNRGAAHANGQYLVFLNNDTRVSPGWLEALLGTFRDAPDVGLVGAKLIYPNGKLQEAGSLVWRDGSAVNYGRDDDPERPEYSFLRRTDYCSAACAILPRALFMEIGGFDTCYSPAYYEDVDLAFKVRARGLQVLVQPHCRVMHHEGGTAGTDLGQGMKRYQVVNQAKFLSRWQHVLDRYPPRPLDERSDFDRDPGKRILVIDHVVPRPDQDSGSMRMFTLLSLLSRHGLNVTFVADNLERLEPYTADLQRIGIEMLYAPYVKSIAQHLEERGVRYHAVLLSKRDPAAKHLDEVRRFAPDAFVIFDTVDLHFVREGREAEIKGDRELSRRAELQKEHELMLVRGADCTIVVSEAERQILAHESERLNVHVIGNIHQVQPTTRPFAERHDLLFVGYFQHTPNVDAALYFVHAVWPRIARALPEVKVHLVGKDPPPEVLALGSTRVRVPGHVPVLDPYLQSCRVMVAPLRFGAGVKGKVTQSLSHGLPLVATTVASEGLDVTDGEELLIADDADAFADSVVRLYRDPALWQRIAENGVRAARRSFSVEAVEAAVVRLIGHAGLDRAKERTRAEG
jgi:GT2 family glycosyltransferase